MTASIEKSNLYLNYSILKISNQYSYHNYVSIANAYSLYFKCFTVIRYFITSELFTRFKLRLITND